MASEDVPVRLVATDDASKKIDAVIDRLEKLEKTIEKGDSSFKRIGETIAGVFGGNLVTGAFSKIQSVASGLFNTLVVDGVHAAAEAEENFNKLGVALASAGNYSEEAAQGFALFAEELQNTTKFSDDAIISAGALLESLTRLDGQGLKTATEAAVNLSAALGIDLDTAVRAVGKAANGETTALQRLGIQIQRGASDAQTFSNTLKALDERFGGTAQAQVNTFAGATTRLANIFNNLQEATGGVVSQNPVLISVLKSLGDIFTSLEKFVKANSKELSEGFSQAILFAINTTKAFIPVLELLIDIGYRIGKVFEAVGTTIGGVFSAIAQAASGNFTAALDVLKSVTDEVGGSLVDAARGAEVSLDPLANALDQVGTSAQKAFESQKEGADAAVPAIENNTRAVNNLTDAQIKAGEAGAKLAEKLTTETGPDQTFAKQSEQLKAAREQDLITEQTYQQAKSDLNEQYSTAEAERLIKKNEELAQLGAINNEQEIASNNAKLDSIIASEQIAADKRTAITQKRVKSEAELERAKLQTAGDIFGNLSSLTKSGNKELFEIGKAAAIASATINTSVAVTKALEAGPFLGPLLAISLAVKGAVEIANIASTKLATGIDSVPGSGNKDNFPALLAPGERVVPRKTNEDLTSFLSNQSRTEALLELIATNINRDQSVIVNVGTEEIVNVVNDSLRSGRALAV